ncbi:MAG: hypothetical protein WCJ35_18470 [Planctomycetota bacterium]
MAVQYDVIACINSLADGALVPNLSPGAPYIYGLVSRTLVTIGSPSASVTGIGTTGYYVVAYDPGTSVVDVVLLIDFGGTFALAGDRYQKMVFRTPVAGGLSAQATRDAMELAPTDIATPQIAGAVPRLNATLNTPETTKTALLPAVALNNAPAYSLPSTAPASWINNAAFDADVVTATDATIPAAATAALNAAITAAADPASVAGLAVTPMIDWNNVTNKPSIGTSTLSTADLTTLKSDLATSHGSGSWAATTPSITNVTSETTIISSES